MDAVQQQLVEWRRVSASDRVSRLMKSRRGHQRFALRLVAGVLLLLLPVTPSQAQDTTSQDRVMETVQTFIRANESANLKLIVATFDDTATVFFPSVQAQRATGKAEIREVFANLFRLRSGSITITPQDVNIQVLDEVAIVTAHLNALPTHPVSEPVTFSRRTFVLRKVGERWLIVHLHASNYLISGTGR